MKVINLKEIRETAENYYKDGDFYCSEAVLKTIKDAFEYECSDDIIKLASGFPAGVGNSGCICGAIAGGSMALGLFFGRSVAKDKKVDKNMELAKEIHDRFRDRNKVTCCRILIKNLESGSEAHVNQCARFTGEVACDVAEIICRELDRPYTK